ncbi:MAG: hypothetical protein UX39_C0011G0005 [Candidatus Magasanikbacteria bacterium GW2011_GWA2_46_17]|uniref:Uncharacterized protein n=1 Tax=Candidatus Magasanikbacteria bacterium GW2011_GWA2_46_17 TaxID=1619042 RepID=A0A0G1P0E4_9BACT|nr:MAG: hypothetical protein UX39_C0011G0005 [Candidatus Magasanikbacteria bacterium GW2011_GWA2_46_17]
MYQPKEQYMTERKILFWRTGTHRVPNHVEVFWGNLGEVEEAEAKLRAGGHEILSNMLFSAETYQQGPVGPCDEAQLRLIDSVIERENQQGNIYGVKAMLGKIFLAGRNSVKEGQ